MTRAGLVLVAALLLSLPRVAQAQLTCLDAPELCDLEVRSTIEQPDFSLAVDIVVLGDGFDDLESWHATADRLIAEMRAHPSQVASRVPNLFNFHVISLVGPGDVKNPDTSDTPLGMISTGRNFTSVNGTRVNLAAANAPDVDITVAIANSDEGRPNAGFPSGLASGGRVRMSRNTNAFAHELGHAVYRLDDEYLERDRCGRRAEWQLVQSPNITSDSSCHKFAHIEGADCVEGGLYCDVGHFRSATSCMMRSNGSPSCPACDRAVTEIQLERRTGRVFRAPEVAFIQPAAGEQLVGWTTLRARVHSMGAAPLRVHWYVDGAYLGAARDTGSEHSGILDTRRLADGPHVLEAVVEDGSGASRRSLPLPVEVRNLSDVEAPPLAIDQPHDGHNVSGLQVISVHADSEDSDVERIELRIDGEVVAVVLGQTELEYPWNTRGLTPGPYEIEARAFDFAQNVSDPVRVRVTVHPSSEVPGELRVAAPRRWSGVGPVFELLLEGNGVEPGAELSLLLDGEALADNPLAGIDASGVEQIISAIVDASEWTLGVHELTVRTQIDAAVRDTAPLALVRVAPAGPRAVWAQPAQTSYAEPAELVLHGYSDAAITELRLLVNGQEVDSSPGPSPATLRWDPAGWSTLCHQLIGEVIDANGARAQTSPRDLCADDRPPELTLLSPFDGEDQPSGGIAAAVDLFDAGGALRRVWLEVDGAEVVVRENTGHGRLDLFATVDDGVHRVQAFAEDGAGNRAETEVVEVFVGDCVAGGCDDDNPCTEDRCAPSGRCIHADVLDCCTVDEDCAGRDLCSEGQCVAFRCRYERIDDCCNDDGDCDDGNPCTRARCTGPGGHCEDLGASCCDSDAACDDGNACTEDGCIDFAGGQCAQSRPGDCCVSDEDCTSPDACMAGSCSRGSCVFAAVPGCCSVGGDCDDGDPCTDDRCNAGSCIHRRRAECCTDASDCITHDPCATATCQFGFCRIDRRPGCCALDSDCDDRSACTEDSCVNEQCQNRPTVGECCFDQECNDGLACTDDVCDEGTCRNPEITFCCETDAQCDDGVRCTIDWCQGSICRHQDAAECCEVDADCEDRNRCTANRCEGGLCVAETVPECCESPEDCDDGDPCTIDWCAEGRCSNQPGEECCDPEEENCCLSDRDCDDGNECTRESCSDGRCVTVLGPACCEDVVDCDDEDACTADRCDNGTCVYAEIEDCCFAAADCDDGDPCTFDYCDRARCQHRPEPFECPTPSPMPSPTPAPSPTPTPMRTPSPSPVASPSPTPVPSASSAPSPEPSVAPSPSPTPTPAPRKKGGSGCHQAPVLPAVWALGFLLLRRRRGAKLGAAGR